MDISIFFSLVHVVKLHKPQNVDATLIAGNKFNSIKVNVVKYSRLA